MFSFYKYQHRNIVLFKQYKIESEENRAPFFSAHRRVQIRPFYFTYTYYHLFFHVLESHILDDCGKYYFSIAIHINEFLTEMLLFFRAGARLVMLYPHHG